MIVKGSFDKKLYLDFLDESIEKIQSLRLKADSQNKTFEFRGVGN